MKQKINYYINEEKRTVTAVLRVGQYEVLEDISNVIDKAFAPSFSAFILRNTPHKVTGKYVGVATCHVDDEWDVETGKKIARLRALRSYMKEYKKIATVMHKDAEKLVENLKKTADYSEFSIKHIEDELNIYLN